MSGPSRREVSVAAVDLGASSGRVMLGRVGPDRLELQQVNRFRNGVVTLPDGLYWDILGLYQDVLAGLGQVARQDPDLAGVGIDTWAIDYGLVHPDSRLVGNPRHYRDPRTDKVAETVHLTVSAEQLYEGNGLQHLPFTTLYQLATEPTLTGVQALLIPDLLGFWLTGNRVTELTNASTTGLLDPRTGRWSTGLFAALDLSPELFAPLAPPGTVVGELTPRVTAETGITRPLTVTTVASHDTASAVVGVPATDPDFAYISCGTWGLVGLELDAPVLTEDSRAANFTNEQGLDGTIRYLRNVMGLWLLSESVRTWGREGRSVDLTELLRQAAAVPSGGPVIDPEDPVFLPPGDMPARIRRVCAEAGDAVPQSIAEIARCILDSLARSFAQGIDDAERLSGRVVQVVHMVGGGSQNELLCQLTADACGRPVVAGPVEATALGNVLVQARTHGVLAGGLPELRAHLRSAVRVRHYHPAHRRT